MIVIEGIRCPEDTEQRLRLEISSRHVLSGSSIIRVDGENGSGKTTLLRILAGMERDYSGTVESPSDLQLRYIPTEVNDLLMPWYSVRRNAHVLLDHDGNGHERVQHFLSLIHSLFKSRASTIIDQLAYRLSAGERATVAVACALVATPSVLLLDETLAHMGRTLLDRVVLAINQFATDGGLVVIVGHHLPHRVNVTGEISVQYAVEG